MPHAARRTCRMPDARCQMPAAALSPSRPFLECPTCAYSATAVPTGKAHNPGSAPSHHHDLTPARTCPACHPHTHSGHSDHRLSGNAWYTRTGSHGGILCHHLQSKPSSRPVCLYLHAVAGRVPTRVHRNSRPLRTEPLFAQDLAAVASLALPHCPIVLASCRAVFCLSLWGSWLSTDKPALHRTAPACML